MDNKHKLTVLENKEYLEVNHLQRIKDILEAYGYREDGISAEHFQTAGPNTDYKQSAVRIRVIVPRES